MTRMGIRTTTSIYDFRNRVTAVDGEIDFYQINVYDNLNRVTRTDRRNTTSTGTLIGRSESDYDDRGRVYQQRVFAVNPSTGAVGNSLVDRRWYDQGSNVIKEWPAGSQAYSRRVYNGMGWMTAEYFGFDTTQSGLGSLSNDRVIEQTETAFDPAGNQTLVTTKKRRQNAGTELGPLNGYDVPNVPIALRYYVAYWPDPIGRQQAIANYGTNGNAVLSYPATIPARSDSVLVTSMTYDLAGRSFETTDPVGYVTRTLYDAADRQTEVIRNYKTSGSGADINNTVQMTYTPDGNIKTVTAINPTTGNQTTTYVYGTDPGPSSLATTNRLREEFLPDSVGSSDRIFHGYNFPGEEIARVDQLLTVRTFEYDALGRKIIDKVDLILNPSVDGSIRRIDTSYDVRGLVDKITSYTTVAATTVVNQVQHVYNDFGQLTSSYQEHNGAVNTATSLRVQYGYANGSANTVRQTSMIYPAGRQIDFTYSTANSISDALSRPFRLQEGSTFLTEDQYVGRSLWVTQDRQAASYVASVTGGSGYFGLDRFDRIVNLRTWRTANPNVLQDHVSYGYNRNSSRLWREWVSDTTDSWDWYYRYDELDRLRKGERGKLLANFIGIDILKFAQEWGLDATGNWGTFKQDNTGDGTWELDQTRTSNVVNEITAISQVPAPPPPWWATPAYNAAGNMSTMQGGRT